jgi:hypothetical protein
MGNQQQDQVAWKWVCGKCGSENVAMLTWTHMNTQVIMYELEGKGTEGLDEYCLDCKDTTKAKIKRM